eukprot:3951561-Pyramimonas_sp.AAC.1
MIRETDADVVLLQEHHLAGALYLKTVNRLQKCGWKVFGTECLYTEAGYPSCGTMVCVRRHCDAFLAPGESAEVVAGRASRCYFRSSEIGVLAIY